MGTLKGDCRIDRPWSDYCDAHQQPSIECMKQGSKRVGVAHWGQATWDMGVSGGGGGRSVTIGSGGGGGSASCGGGAGGYQGTVVAQGAACKACGGGEWVCENHTDKPWDGTSKRADACGCGAGAPCPECNHLYVHPATMRQFKVATCAVAVGSGGSGGGKSDDQYAFEGLAMAAGLWVTRFDAMADAIVALNNSSPRLPTKEQIIETLRSI